MPLFVVVANLSIAHAQNDRIFKEWDKNKDGVLEREEIPAGPRQIFDQKDADGDGKITMEEHMGRAGKGKGMRPKGGEKAQPTGNAAFTIRQTWNQEPDGYDRPVHVTEPANAADKVPVVIYFHGAGGSASRGGRWASSFPNHLLVSPQGYLKNLECEGRKIQSTRC